jgi:hypothetical protein
MEASEKFGSEIGILAQKHGVKSVIIVVRDPNTNKATLFASPGAKEDLRGFVAEKMGFSDGSDESETGWGG